MNVLKFQVNELCFVGDLHGEFTAIRHIIKELKVTDTLFVFCGDIGMGFHKLEYYVQTLRPIEKLCKETNNYCVFIRGNHDDEEYFNGLSDNQINERLPFGDNFYKKNQVDTEHLIFVPDYTVLEVAINENDYHPAYTETVLCVGGGISIDRSERKQRMLIDYNKMCRHMSSDKAKDHCMKLYWEKEPPVFDWDKLNEITENKKYISIMATHTAPSFCPPYTKDGIAGWLAVDEKLGEDLTNERKVMDNIFEYLTEHGHPLKSWYYGHFHFRDRMIVDGVEFWLLDMTRNGNLFYRIHNAIEL